MLELVHTNVCGPMEAKSFSGCSYFVTFVDDASRKVWVFILKSKGDVFDIFKGFHVAVERKPASYSSALEATMLVSIHLISLMIIIANMALDTRRQCPILPN